MARRHNSRNQRFKEQHKKELIDVLTRLEKAGHKLSEQNPNFSKQRLNGLAIKLTKMESDHCKIN